MSLEETLSEVLERHEELKAMLSQPGLSSEEFSKLSKEYAEIDPIANSVTELNKTKKELHDAEGLLSEPDMAAEAKKEIQRLKAELPALEKQVQRMLLPKDIADERNALLEIRAGAGGDEAGLFGALLFEMYRKYAAHRGWQFEVMSLSENDLGGLKEGVAQITGKGVFARMKFESGVHRVQRVPQTESSGRVHTSTATVAVLPEMEDVDIEIDEKDLKIDVYRASGAGGQHVNKTESAVRITHMPTGIVVAMQDERSQHKNKAKAMKILRSKLYEKKSSEIKSAHAAERKGQVGTGDRSERIRTYNFPQGRVSDHRIELTLYKLDEVLNGTGLDEFIDALITQDEAEKLAELNNG
ncbi:MAG: peptide chain release factor 1 [Alphaproteobacteria bacterium]|nr:peptide chain release factor 1 [Alphaproteobacteria bacterium]MCL2504741.1 peptide chain release factor 1 [Alphaproteobacteria bacterium]